MTNNKSKNISNKHKDTVSRQSARFYIPIIGIILLAIKTRFFFHRYRYYTPSGYWAYQIMVMAIITILILFLK